MDRFLEQFLKVLTYWIVGFGLLFLFGLIVSFLA